MLDGELRVDVGGQTSAAGAGAVAFLPRQLPHAFVVTSPQAGFLTLHTPAGFDKFTQGGDCGAFGAYIRHHQSTARQKAFCLR